jgi:hypothetical protein
VENVKTSSNYIVASSHDTEICIFDTDLGIMTVYDSVSQREINLHGKNVGSGLTLLAVDLNWGDSKDSFRPKIYAPSGSVLGSYYIYKIKGQEIQLTNMGKQRNNSAKSVLEFLER